MPVVVTLKCDRKRCGHEYELELHDPYMVRDADGTTKWRGMMGSDGSWCRKCDKGCPEVIGVAAVEMNGAVVIDEPTVEGVNALRAHVRELRRMLRYVSGNLVVSGAYEKKVKAALKKSEKMVD